MWQVGVVVAVLTLSVLPLLARSDAAPRPTR
jgi:hypothetical protein